MRIRRFCTRFVALAGLLALLASLHAARADDARLILAKVGIETLTPTERIDLWKRVDQWATADSLLDFCGRKLNIFKRGWNAVTACVDTASLRKVGYTFRTKKAEYMKILAVTYADPERKKAYCDGLGPQLKEYARIINAQIAEADGMCRACLWC